jgi:hypothetical protein
VLLRGLPLFGRPRLHGGGTGGPDGLAAWVEHAAADAAENGGPDFLAAPYRLEVVEDDYGRESYEARIYFRGPLRWGGSPRALRLDVTRDEHLALPAVPRPLDHPFTDAALFAGARLPCYALLEILAEKVRAVCGQRRFAIARDLYDIHRLLQGGLAPADLAALLPAKLAARGLAPDSVSTSRLERRRAEYELDWQRRLAYLVPSAATVPFEDAWQGGLRLIAELEQRLA